MSSGVRSRRSSRQYCVRLRSGGYWVRAASRSISRIFSAGIERINRWDSGDPALSRTRTIASRRTSLHAHRAYPPPCPVRTGLASATSRMTTMPGRFLRLFRISNDRAELELWCHCPRFFLLASFWLMLISDLVVDGMRIHRRPITAFRGGSAWCLSRSARNGAVHLRRRIKR